MRGLLSYHWGGRGGRTRVLVPCPCDVRHHPVPSDTALLRQQWKALVPAGTDSREMQMPLDSFSA